MNKHTQEPKRKEKPCEMPLKSHFSRISRLNVLSLGFTILGAMTILLLGINSATAELKKNLLSVPEKGLIFSQNTATAPLSESLNEKKQPVKKINVVITAYSSTIQETDESPFLTASGAYVKDGIVANNLLPFGTRIRIPELYGKKVFVVEDRMHWKKGNYHVDIWFPEYSQALKFGAKKTYIEVLEG